MCPSSSDLSIPFVSTDQMREVDRAMEEDYGISLIQMMENAGRNLAHLARDRFLCGDPTGRRVLVLAGTGGNGGGGLVCARWLHNWGASVQVWATAAPSEFSEVPRHQLAILERLVVPVHVTGKLMNLPPADPGNRRYHRLQPPRCAHWKGGSPHSCCEHPWPACSCAGRTQWSGYDNRCGARAPRYGLRPL